MDFEVHISFAVFVVGISSHSLVSRICDCLCPPPPAPSVLYIFNITVKLRKADSKAVIQLSPQTGNEHTIF